MHVHEQIGVAFGKLLREGRRVGLRAEHLRRLAAAVEGHGQRIGQLRLDLDAHARVLSVAFDDAVVVGRALDLGFIARVCSAACKFAMLAVWTFFYVRVTRSIS